MKPQAQIRKETRLYKKQENEQLDKYGAFGAKDEEGEESFSRWTAPQHS